MAVVERAPLPTEPSAEWVVVTKSDSTVYDPPPRAIYVGVAGTLTVVDRKGVEATINVPQGTLGLRPTKIKTGGTASEILALY